MAVETECAQVGASSPPPRGDSSHPIKQEKTTDAHPAEHRAAAQENQEVNGAGGQAAGQLLRVDVGEPLNAEAMARLTNFSIEEILKPSFGKRRKLDHHPHHHHHNHHHHRPTTTLFCPQTLHVKSPTFHEILSPTSCKRVEHCSSQSSQSFHHHRNGGSHASPKSVSPGVGRRQSTDDDEADEPVKGNGPEILWPAWVYCTRYSDRPSSGPRSRKVKKRDKKPDEKRPRTAFTNEQLARLKKEFDENRYLTEARRQDLAKELKLNESQIKIWFQNKRAKMKKSTGTRNTLALQLMAQGLYNHSTNGNGLSDDSELGLNSPPLSK